jgi:hypothetical protein
MDRGPAGGATAGLVGTIPIGVFDGGVNLDDGRGI